MSRHLRPLTVSAQPTPEQLAALTAVLDDPQHCALPVTDDADGARVSTAARVDEPLAPHLADAVLAVATTGSTGTPKIVLHSRSSLRASIDATAARLGGHGSWLLCLGINHIAGIQVVLRSAVGGTAPVVCPAGGVSFVAEFVTATQRLGGDRRYVSVVPTQLQRLLDGGAGDVLASFDAILLGGAAADPALLARAEDAGAHVVTTYGMSETGGGCVYDGEPLDGVSAGITPDGQIQLTGPVVGLGYREAPSPTPFRVYDFGERTFTTSDLGVITHGRLRVLGRSDDIINTGGKKVSPVRVEQALRSLPEITDAIVIGVPDDEWGERVVALVTALGDYESPTAEAVRRELRDELAAHELPREVRAVHALPTKGIGKPDRGAALARWLAQDDED